MRFLQLLPVASLVSIGIGVALSLSTASMPLELLKVDVAELAAPREDEDGETPEAAVTSPFAFAATREEAVDDEDDGDAATESEAADDDANEAASHDVNSAETALIARSNCTIKIDPPALEDYVAVRRFDNGEPFRANHLPVEDGSYRFADLPAGRYEVRLNSFEVDLFGRLVDGLPLGTLEIAPGEDREIVFSRP